MAVGFGSLMSALDTSAVNATLPVVRAAFDSPVATVQWVVIIYLLVVSGLLLTFGRLGDLRGHRTFYLAGFSVFVAGSFSSAMAPAVAWLVASRGVQALGAAMLYATTPAILTRSFSQTRRGQALGVQAAMTYTGLTLGPSLGGWMASTLGWRSVYLMNVPVGLVGIVLAMRFLPHDPPLARGERFDIPGAALFAAGLVALLLGLNRGSTWGWGSPAVLGLIALGALLLGSFWLFERRTAMPMLDTSLFSDRGFAAASVSAVLSYMSTSGIGFVLPFYLMQGRGLESTTAGLILIAQPILMAVTAPLSGSLSDRIGPRWPATLGVFTIALGAALLALMGLSVPIGGVMLSLALMGLGSGLFTSPNGSALMGSAPRTRQGIASGVLALSRNVGMTLGVGLTGAVFTTGLARQPGSEALTVLAAVCSALWVGAGVAALGGVVSALRGNGRG